MRVDNDTPTFLLYDCPYMSSTEDGKKLSQPYREHWDLITYFHWYPKGKHLLRNVDRFPSVEFSPFDEREADVFFQNYRDKYPFVTEVKCLKEITNYNPLLLHECTNSDYKTVDGMVSARHAVEKVVRATVNDTSKSVTDQNFKWVIRSLLQSIEMFYYASISESLPIGRIDEYLIATREEHVSWTMLKRLHHKAYVY